MWKPWWDFWVRLSGELASLRGSSKRLFVALLSVVGSEQVAGPQV